MVRNNAVTEYLCYLPPQNTFPNLYKTLQLENSDLWMPFQRSSQCEQDIPSSIAKKISLFQQVTKLTNSLFKSIGYSLGKNRMLKTAFQKRSTCLHYVPFSSLISSSYLSDLELRLRQTAEMTT